MRRYTISVTVETTQTKAQLQHCYYAAICDRITLDGQYAKIVNVKVAREKQP